MKLYEMMDKTPLQFTEGKTYLDYMRKHRPNHLQEIFKLLIQNGIERDKYLAVLNLGADMAMLQVLNYGILPTLARCGYCGAHGRPVCQWIAR